MSSFCRASYGGIKIINHPGEEDPQVKRVKAQIQHAEIQHNALKAELEKLRMQQQNKKKSEEENISGGMPDDEMDDQSEIN